MPAFKLLEVPVAFVKTIADGVPNAGVTNVGDVLNTLSPDPVLVVTPVPPERTGKVPVVNALVDVAYNAPPDVNDVKFVPPLAVPNVPAKVTAPVVAEEGVKPVDPALNEETALVEDIVILAVEYHCVVLEALNSIHPLTGRLIGELVAIASIEAPVAGYTLIGFVPLLTTIILRPVVAVGNVTPDGLAAVVVTTIKSDVNAPCPCALVPAVKVTVAE